MSEEPVANGVVERPRGRDWIAETEKKARALLTEHPVLAIACAVGIGFLVGRLLTGLERK